MTPLRTILHPTDFSEPSRNAFRVACSLARDQGARVVVLHVTPPPDEGVPRPAEEVEALWTKLRQLRDEDPTARVETLLREGDPVTEIPRVVREFHCDLVVMGTHAWRGGTGC